MATTSAIIGAIAAIASAGTGIAGATGAFGGTAAAPTPKPLDTTTTAKSLLPGEKANAAANLGGGISPDFLANVVGAQSGTPGSGLGILDDIRRSLNVQS